MRGEKYLYPGAMTPLIRDLLDSARDDLPSLREDPLTPRPLLTSVFAAQAVSPFPGAVRPRARLAIRARVLLSEGGSTRCPCRCARSATRSPSSSSTCRPSRGHRGPTRASAPGGRDRALAVREFLRRLVGGGFQLPRRRRGFARRASDVSRSERSETGPPSASRRDLRRRRHVARRGHRGRASARSQTVPPRHGLPARSGIGRRPAAAQPVRPLPRTRGR
jgi:hypothetical protein